MSLKVVNVYISHSSVRFHFVSAALSMPRSAIHKSRLYHIKSVSHAEDKTGHLIK